MKVTDDDIRERIREYELALRTETEASLSVRDAWRKMVTMFHELVDRREKDRKLGLTESVDVAREYGWRDGYAAGRRDAENGKEDKS